MYTLFTFIGVCLLFIRVKKFLIHMTPHLEEFFAYLKEISSTEFMTL